MHCAAVGLSPSGRLADRGCERAMLIVKRRASMEREARNLSGGEQYMNG